MTAIGIKPGDAVLLIEHRGEQQLVYNALVTGFSMKEDLRGTHGEPAIKVCFVPTRTERCLAHDGGGMPTLRIPRVVHISHPDFIDGSAALGYEELPEPIPGICRFCRCTGQRACPGGCAWIDPEQTICSNPLCMAKFREELCSESSH